MSNERVCRLCLELISSDTCQVLDDMKLEMLQFLFLNLDKDVSQDPIICSNCVENLQLSFDFRTSCLTNSNYFKCHVYNYNSDVLDSVNVSMKGDSLDCTREEKIICKFCLNYFEKNSLKEINMEMEEDVILTRIMFEKCLPEIDVNIEKQLMCQNCLEFLQIQFNFIMTCLDNEERIRNEEHENFSDISNKIKKLKQPDISIDVKIEPEDVNIDEYISNNLLEIKKEEEMETIEENEYHVKEEMEELQEDDGDEKLQESNKLEEMEYGFSSGEYTCILCTCQSAQKLDLKKHSLLHEALSNEILYKCSKCEYFTKCKSQFTQHEIKHKGQFEIKIQKCSDCQYPTMYKNNLTSHFELKPGDIPDIYKCNECSYTTKTKLCIKLHRRSHMETTQHKCDYCNYKTKSSYWLKKHMEKYTSRNEFETHKCGKCDFVARHRCVLLEHNGIHNETEKKRKKKEKETTEPSEYKCKECEYVTHMRCYLNKHAITHLDPSEVTMYQCTECPFQTKHKVSIQKHVRRLHPYITQL